MSDVTMVWPTLRAADAPALIRFLVDAFGFEETLVVSGAGGRIDHAELRWPPGGGVMLGSVRDDGDDVWALRPGTSGCHVVTDDIDALYERATAAGATITRKLAGTDYGSRDFIAEDPEGNRWSFGTYSGAARSGATE